MALYVGDVASEVFSTGTAGETFTRTASYVNGVSTTFNPTFTDLGSGFYRYTYTTATTGFHEWAGTGSLTGALTINFDVDANPTASVISIPGVSTAMPVGTLTGGGGPRPAYIPQLIIYRGENWSWPMRVLANGVLIDTSTYTASLTVRAAADSGQLLFASTSNGLVTVGYDPPIWTASTIYGLGQQVVPTTPNNSLYVVTTAGTSGGSEPTWPTTLSGTVVNGSVTFTNIGTDSGVTNLRIALVPGDAEALGDWQIGLFDVQITDAFGRVQRIAHGNVVLDHEIN